MGVRRRCTKDPTNFRKIKANSRLCPLQLRRERAHSERDEGTQAPQ